MTGARRTLASGIHLGNKCCNRSRLGVVLGQGYKYEPLEFVIGIEQFHNKPALCQLLGVGIRVTRKIRVGFFGVSRNRVSENATRCLTDEMETRHFGYPKIRVRIQVIPELTEQSALFKNSQKNFQGHPSINRIHTAQAYNTIQLYIHRRTKRTKRHANWRREADHTSIH
jgi:hypothetical protein